MQEHYTNPSVFAFPVESMMVDVILTQINTIVSIWKIIISFESNRDSKQNNTNIFICSSSDVKTT